MSVILRNSYIDYNEIKYNGKTEEYNVKLVKTKRKTFFFQIKRHFD